MNAKELTWRNAVPTKPGRYIFRHSIGLDLPPMELIYALHDPTAYKWRIVDVVKYEDGWLTWLDENGVNRVCNTFGCFGGDERFWFAEFPEVEERILKAEAERDLLRIKYEGLTQDECEVGKQYLIEDGFGGTEIVTMTDKVISGDRVFQHVDGTYRTQHGHLQRFFPMEIE